MPDTPDCLHILYYSLTLSILSSLPSWGGAGIGKSRFAGNAGNAGNAGISRKKSVSLGFEGLKLDPCRSDGFRLATHPPYVARDHHGPLQHRIRAGELAQNPKIDQNTGNRPDSFPVGLQKHRKTQNPSVDFFYIQDKSSISVFRIPATRSDGLPENRWKKFTYFRDPVLEL